jgi:hypothetical protein
VAKLPKGRIRKPRPKRRRAAMVALRPPSIARRRSNADALGRTRCGLSVAGSDASARTGLRYGGSGNG